MDTEKKQSELDKRYIRMASIWAENSYCQRRKVGALIVKDKMIISDGYNGTPSGFKGYTPELSFEERKEILESIRYVKEVVAGPWLITDEFMDSVNCDLLVHGADNVNHVRPERLVIFPRTEGVSSSTLRERVLDCLIQMNIDSKKGNTGDKVARFMIELIKKEFRLE